jgi:hypothetical protein
MMPTIDKLDKPKPGTVHTMVTSDLQCILTAGMLLQQKLDTSPSPIDL